MKFLNFLKRKGKSWLSADQPPKEETELLVAKEHHRPCTQRKQGKVRSVRLREYWRPSLSPIPEGNDPTATARVNDIKRPVAPRRLSRKKKVSSMPHEYRRASSSSVYSKHHQPPYCSDHDDYWNDIPLPVMIMLAIHPMIM